MTPPRVRSLLPLMAAHTLESITLEPNIPTISKNGTKKHKNTDFIAFLNTVSAILPLDSSPSAAV